MGTRPKDQPPPPLPLPKGREKSTEQHLGRALSQWIYCGPFLPRASPCCRFTRVSQRIYFSRCGPFFCFCSLVRCRSLCEVDLTATKLSVGLKGQPPLISGDLHKRIKVR